MPTLYMLVGVSCSGKSTWHAHFTPIQNAVYVNTDRYVEEYAKNMDKTYSEVFNDVMPMCIEHMLADVENARDAGQDIVWDQTSTTIKTRKKKIDMLPDYHKIAVVFETPGRAELDVRLSGRPGKHIPKNVVDSMIAGWQEPTMEEGFDEIWKIGWLTNTKQSYIMVNI